MQNTINNRLKLLRKELGFNQTEISNKTGMAQNSYSYMETGKKPVTEKNIKLICLTFNVNENWLRHGQGDMFNPPSTAQDEDEVRLLAMFRKLSKEMKQLVLRKVDQILALDEEWVAQPQDDSSLRKGA